MLANYFYNFFFISYKKLNQQDDILRWLNYGPLSS